MRGAERSAALVLGCAAVLWAGWIIACANNSAPSAQAPQPAPAPAADDDGAMRCASEASGAALSECESLLLSGFGNGQIDIDVFNQLADARLAELAPEAKTIAAECAAQPAGPARLECIEAGQRRRTDSPNWDAYAVPKQ